MLKKLLHAGACRNTRLKPRFHLVRRAVITAFWNSAVIAAEIPWVGLTSKNSPGDAQLCMVGLISFTKA